MISSLCVKTTTLCYVVTILALVFLLSCVLSKLKAADAAVYCANLLCHTYLVTGELHFQTTALHCALGFYPKTDLCALLPEEPIQPFQKMKYDHIAALHYHIFFMQK